MPSAKFDVEMSGFRSGIAAAKNEVKTLDAQMKNLDATMKVQGKSEQTLSQQTETLNKRMAAQKTMAENAKNALDAMTREGIDPASDSYQRMARELLNAQTGMMETQASLNDLGSGAVKAAEGADKLETGLKGITKKISLDQVITGISKISDGLKNAAQHAINLGESLFNAVMDKARLADDNATMAMMYGIDLDTYLKMQGLVASGMDTSVDAILKAQSKLNKGIGDGKAQETLRELKITMSSLVDTGDGIPEFVRKDPAKMFWEVGNAIMAMGDAYDKEAAAQNVFGRSWKELVPLFERYHSLEEYKKALNSVQVISEEENTSLADMADSFDNLHQKLDTLTTKILAQFAPGLTDLSESLSGLLSNILEYLDTPEGKEALAGMAESISSLFDDLKGISAEDAVRTFQDILDKIVGGFKWISDNSGKIMNGLIGIGAFWAALEVSEGALTIVKIINGIKDLATTKAAGEAAGGAWGSGFAAGLMRVAPWVVGLVTMLNPSSGGDKIGNNSLVDEKGNLTQEAIQYGYKKDENGELVQSRRVIIEEAAQTAWDLYRTNKLDREGLDELRNKVLNDEHFASLTELMFNKTKEEGWKNIEDLDLQEWLDGIEPPEVTIEPIAPEGAADSIAEQIGTVTIPIALKVAAVQSVVNGVMAGAQAMLPGHANGLPFVPYDGYLALLHQGERVMTATENRHYTYNSHNYFGNVNLNNGQDIENLCDRIDVHNRRQQAGYGG